jgi:hypothetical protein
MLLAQQYAPDLTKVKDYLVKTPLGYMVRGDMGGAVDKLGSDAKLRVDAMMNPETAIETGMDIMGGGLLGTFVGKGSKLWKKADYNKALKLEKEGATPEQIWQETGTAKFADGKWRQEISDLNSKITDNVYETIKAKQPYRALMSDTLKHPELYKSYPDIGNIKTGMYAWQKPEGSYMADTRTITAGGPSTGHQKSAVLHEIQHDIQEAENFAKGGNLDEIIWTFEDLARKKREEAKKLLDYNNAFGSLSRKQLGSKADEIYSAKDKALKLEEQAKAFDNKVKEAYSDSDKKFEMYEKMAGEAEARLTQRRMNLTDAERRANFPYNYGTYYGLDYPMEELFVQGLLK